MTGLPAAVQRAAGNGSAPTSERRSPRRFGKHQAAASAVMVILAIASSFATARWPLLSIGGAVAIVGIGIVLSRLSLAVALLAASFFFTNYLNSGVGLLTPDKAIGGIAVLAWLLEWGTGRRPVVGVRHFWPIGLLAVWIGLSITVARDDTAALTTTVRYLLFFILFFLVIQTIQGDRRKADFVINVVVGAAAIAALIGLASFLMHQVDRAKGPLNDPNDFAFLLGSATPLVIYRIRWSRTRIGRGLASLALILVFAAILATFSRSALIGLAVAGVWAIFTRRLLVRWGIVSVVGVGMIALIGFMVQPQFVQTAFNQKAAIADTNVSTRFFLWNVAWEEFVTSPVTGVGPGNYEARFQEFAATPAPSLGTFTTHNAYLNVLSELGLPGFALFLAYLIMSWLDLRRKFPDDAQSNSLQTALACGFLVAVVGSMFLTEQFYPPLWFLPAIGVSLANARALGTTTSKDKPNGMPRAPASAHPQA